MIKYLEFTDINKKYSLPTLDQDIKVYLCISNDAPPEVFSRWRMLHRLVNDPLPLSLLVNLVYEQNNPEAVVHILNCFILELDPPMSVNTIDPLWERYQEEIKDIPDISDCKTVTLILSVVEAKRKALDRYVQRVQSTQIAHECNLKRVEELVKEYDTQLGALCAKKRSGQITEETFDKRKAALLKEHHELIDEIMAG